MWGVVGVQDRLWYVHRGAHVHPIPFDSEREARRAADRLNARDGKK